MVVVFKNPHLGVLLDSIELDVSLETTYPLSLVKYSTV